ncbi:MAG: ribosome maturation factor RimP [Clostridia bacterium]|nr:ribosome maturation factor RimP [Clostridia bacterium]
MADVKQRAEQATKDAIEALGYEIVEVTYKKEFGTPTLTFFVDVDREGGINLDDCEKISRTIDPILDKEDVTDGVAYNLNVSSPGLDRPLKTERDFRKHLEKEIEIGFYAPYQGKKKIERVLVAWNDETITVSDGKNQETIDRKLISIIKPVIKF